MEITSKIASGIILTNGKDLNNAMFIELNGLQQHYILTKAQNSQIHDFYGTNKPA
jgi:hypothetical protein